MRDARGDDAVEMRVQSGYAGGNVEVELVHIDVVATPGQRFAVGGEDDSGDVADRAGGAMVAGNPLRRDERERAGGDGKIDLSVVELARRVGEVGGDLNWGLLGES